MLIKPELIVYLWLFPAFLFFVFPVLFLPLILLKEKLPSAETQRSEERKSVFQPHGYATDADKRGFPRQKIAGIIAHVSDGVRCCSGSIADISQSGVCLVSPKGELDQNADKLGVLLTGAGESFQIAVKPRWKVERGGKLSIGASIEESLGNWDSFAGKGDSRQFVNAV